MRKLAIPLCCAALLSACAVDPKAVPTYIDGAPEAYAIRYFSRSPDPAQLHREFSDLADNLCGRENWDEKSFGYDQPLYRLGLATVWYYGSVACRGRDGSVKSRPLS